MAKVVVYDEWEEKLAKLNVAAKEERLARTKETKRLIEEANEMTRHAAPRDEAETA